MAIKIISSYAKKLGLPGYSSHSFGVTVETELIDTGEVQGEVARIYELLQGAVDREIQHTGFIPSNNESSANGGSHTRIGSGHREANESAQNGHWKCSDKQQDLILKLVDEHNLDRSEVDNLAHQRFNKGVKQLNKIEASGLIDELLETYGPGQRQANRRNGSAYRRSGGREAA